MRYQVLNLPAQRRPFLRNLGTEKSIPSQGLSSIPLDILMNRRKIMLLPYQIEQGGVNRNFGREQLIGRGWPWIEEATLAADEGWYTGNAFQIASAIAEIPADQIAAVYRVGLDPSSEDEEDASLIDRIYSQPAMSPSKLNQDPFDVELCHSGLIPFKARDGQFQPKSVEIKGDFYCSSWAKKHGLDKDSLWSGIPPTIVWWGETPDAQAYRQTQSLRAGFYGIDTSLPWGDLKQTTLNASVVDEVLKTYPFPAPFDSPYIDFWSQLARPALHDFISLPAPINTDAARAFITFSVLENYAGMVEALVDYAEDKKKRMKKNAQIVGIAVAVIGGFMALVALPIVAAVTLKTVAAGAGAITKVKSAELSRTLNDIAGAFEEEAPAFAGEVRFANEWQEKAVASVQDAIGRGDSTAALPSMSSGLKTGLLVAGGLAVVGSLAYLIFK